MLSFCDAAPLRRNRRHRPRARSRGSSSKYHWTHSSTRTRTKDERRGCNEFPVLCESGLLPRAARGGRQSSGRAKCCAAAARDSCPNYVWLHSSNLDLAQRPVSQCFPAPSAIFDGKGMRRPREAARHDQLSCEVCSAFPLHLDPRRPLGEQSKTSRLSVISDPDPCNRALRVQTLAWQCRA